MINHAPSYVFLNIASLGRPCLLFLLSYISTVSPLAPPQTYEEKAPVLPSSDVSSQRSPPRDRCRPSKSSCCERARLSRPASLPPRCPRPDIHDRYLLSDYHQYLRPCLDLQQLFLRMLCLSSFPFLRPICKSASLTNLPIL
jgi:hypothetical protein